MLLPMLLWLTAIYLAPSMAGGIGLLSTRPWGRILIVIVSVCYLIFFPIGTILGGLGLWILLGREGNTAFSGGTAPAPVEGPAAVRPPSIENRTGLLLTIAAVGAGFVVMLGAGFMWTGTAAPMEISVAFYPALVVLAVAVGYALYHLATRPEGLTLPDLNPPWSPVALVQEASARHAAAEQGQQHIARLAADPRRKKYIPLIERGEYWPDERIDYDLDPTHTATCAHLRPIERAMRAAGICVALHSGATVNADCVVDADRTRQDFNPGATTGYREFEHYDRSPEAQLVGQIWCTACNSSIDTVHPQTASPGTSRFPA
jgi:hypothetical protein